MGVAYLVVNWLPFDSYSIAWDRRQILYLIFYYFVLAVPFIFAGLGIGASLSIETGKSNLIYAVNLIGSAAGIAISLVIMQVAGVPGAMLVSALTALIAVAGYQIWDQRKILLWLSAVLVPGLLLLCNLIWLNFGSIAPAGVTISPYKGLAYAMRIPGSQRLFGAWNAISRLDVLSGASTRVMPGLSYTFPGNLPQQYGLAADGDSLQPITLVDPQKFNSAGYLPEAPAFKIKSDAHVLVIEPGGGLGVLQALSSGAQKVNAVISNPLIVNAVSTTVPKFNIYSSDRVQVKSTSGRVYLDSTDETFDVIFLPLTSPYRPIASGAYSLTETYDLTLEAVKSMLSRLNEDGILIITRWLQTPPSETLRSLATIFQAMQETGFEAPGEHIIAYRGVQTMTMLTKTGDWKFSEVDQIHKELEKLRFDLVWSPGITPELVNRFNQLPEPSYYLAASELVTQRDRTAFIKDYSFDIRPVTDDKPFFFHFFRWEQTPQIMANFGRVWQPFGGSGYFVLIALLILAAGFSILLIVLPLAVRSRTISNHQDPTSIQPVKSSYWRVLAYFAFIGLAYLFIEIPLIQMGILLMEHPVYAFALVVITLLIFSSVGSMISRQAYLPKKVSMMLVFALALFTPILVKSIQDNLLGWPILPRALIFVLSMVPLGICMGMPFPFGLEWLESSERSLIPWAWTVNGFASVIASVLAALLVLNYGFSFVLILGAASYGIAVLVMNPHSR